MLPDCLIHNRIDFFITSSSQFESLGKKVGGKVYILTTLPKLLCQIHFILTFFQENYKIQCCRCFVEHEAFWNGLPKDFCVPRDRCWQLWSFSSKEGKRQKDKIVSRWVVLLLCSNLIKLYSFKLSSGDLYRIHLIKGINPLVVEVPPAFNISSTPKHSQLLCSNAFQDEMFFELCHKTRKIIPEP